MSHCTIVFVTLSGFEKPDDYEILGNVNLLGEEDSKTFERSILEA